MRCAEFPGPKRGKANGISKYKENSSTRYIGTGQPAVIIAEREIKGRLLFTIYSK